MPFTVAMKAYSLGFLALLAGPGALAAPSVPLHGVGISARSSEPMRMPVHHMLHEKRHIQARQGGGQDGVSFGSYWFAGASAGSPAQDVTLLIDTGSSDLWILSPDVSSDQSSGQQLYDPSKSSSAAQMQGSNFNIGYGEGGNGVSGPVYTDTFSMGGASVSNMAIGSANSLTGLPGGIFKSGIVGLAFEGGNSIKPNGQPTFMETLQPSLASPVFVCNFKMAGGGFIEFGNVDSSLYTGSLTTLQADNTTTYPASWSSEGVSYVSNGNTLGTFDIVFDTGGPSTSGPIAVVNAYYAQIQGASDVNGDGSSWTVPCDTQMPDLEFHFSGGAVGVIPGAKLLQDPSSSGASSCGTWFGKENSPTRGLVGDAFFNSNVVVFNQADATISWAPQV